MNREAMYAIMQGAGTTDYELYLNTPALLACQKDYKDLANRDELQFQIVHQVEELWMKLIGYTLLDITSASRRGARIASSRCSGASTAYRSL